jgi:hypothetical protein
MATDKLIDALRSTRADYAEETACHKFLLDAVFGTGGFRGKYGVTSVSQLGWAAEAYTSTVSALLTVKGMVKRETYLDQFPREDIEKFDRRIDIAHYTNYVGPILDLLLSYINKAAVNRDKIPESVEDWLSDVDGKGAAWDTIKREVIVPRAAALGWCPVMFDLPEAAEANSLAKQREMGISPRCYPLYPLNILDWIVDENGTLSAVKIRTDHRVRTSLLEATTVEERYAMWYPDRVERCVVTTVEGKEPSISEVVTSPHSYGCVPLVVFRAKPTPDDRVRGVSAISNSAIAARRLFNLESEMDDHIRGQVFATLGVPVTDTTVNIGELVGGSGSVIKVPMESRHGLHYVAPPASCADTIEKRMEVTVREIYRTEQVEHTKPTGTTASSGVARAYEFEQTNRRLGSMAMTLARAEQDALRLVGKLLGSNEAENLTVSAPTDFSVEDLASEIDGVLSAMQANLGPTAETEMRRRLVSRILPNLPVATQEAIAAELEQIRAQSSQDSAALGEVEDADVEPDAESGDNGEPGDTANKAA